MAKGRLHITWQGGEKRCLAEATESGVWKTVAEILPTIDVPNTITVEFRKQSAELEVTKRGTFVKNGITYPSMYVSVSYNNITLPPSNYKQAYLTCVNPESNNYKFYWLRPLGNGKLQATYGRIGSERGEMFGVKDLNDPYDSFLYWIRYYEKLSKGYVDMSDIYLDNTTKDGEKEEKKEEVSAISAKLFSMLQSYAKNYVSAVLTNAENITVEMVKKTREELNKLGQATTVTEFNQILAVILQISPRRARYINEMYARRPSDFAQIVTREEGLLSAMEVLTGGKRYVSTDCFEAHGIKIYECTEKQREEVLRHLEDHLHSRVKTIYRVIDSGKKRKFDNYLKHNRIKKVKEFWHGSRNENWLSIMLNGLQLNPNAKITGKMFGYGIYFAPKAQKSLGYTSCSGSYWAHGSSTNGFMGLYATAYGDPMFVKSAGHYTKQSLGSHNCVHATPANTGLRNEEVIFYDEDSVVLNYIVEFSA